MKKILFVLGIIALAFSLSGCNSYKANKFNKNLSFTEEIKGQDKTKLIEEIKNKWTEFSKATIIGESKYESDDSSENASYDLEFKAYSNDVFQLTGTSKSNTNSDGIKLSEKEDIDVCIWNYKTDKSVVERSKVNNEYTYSVINTYANEADGSKTTYLEAFQYIEGMTSNISGLDVYKDGSGYVLIQSSRQESYVGVNWGSEVKERYTLNENQIIFVVNKNYEIEKILMYSAITTNRDPDTNQWYKRNKRISIESVEIKLTYGKVKENKNLENELNSDYTSKKNS